MYSDSIKARHLGFRFAIRPRCSAAQPNSKSSRLRTMVCRSNTRSLITWFLGLISLSSLVSAIRYSQYELPERPTVMRSRVMLELPLIAEAQIVARGKYDGWPSFREAPVFRNGKQCAFVSRVGNELESVCDKNSVHIAMTLDEKYLRGSMAAVFSILKHTGCPENVIFHFLVADRDSELRSLIYSTFPFLRFKVYHFDESLVHSKISPSVRPALEHPLNYARSYLADILESCIQRVIYLDSDLIVVDDIVKLWGTKLGPHAIGAPEYCHTNLTRYFTDAFWQNSTLTRTFEGKNPCYFNTGVMVMDMVKWRSKNYRAKIEEWMSVQSTSRIYYLGSLPPFLLVFGGLVEPIDHRWNQHGLGGDNLEGRCRPLHPGPVSLLHWSGKGKPWIRIDQRKTCPVDSLWAPYDLLLPTASSYQ